MQPTDQISMALLKFLHDRRVSGAVYHLVSMFSVSGIGATFRSSMLARARPKSQILSLKLSGLSPSSSYPVI